MLGDLKRGSELLLQSSLITQQQSGMRMEYQSGGKIAKMETSDKSVHLFEVIELTYDCL